MVRHGTKPRLMTLACASKATATGRSRSAYRGPSGPCACAAVIAMPQSATAADASGERSLVHSAYGA